MADTELMPIELTNETIESMIYEIRGQKVMLDFELAKIYGYETKNFNRQVKNNIVKFPDEFRFQLTYEVERISRCKKFTAIPIMQKDGIKGGRTSLPWAFTEQGLYMLMTILKGDLATKQSLALVRAFKQMKDYIVENVSFLPSTTSYLESRFASIDKRFEVIEHRIDTVMDNFIDESTYKHFIILNGEKIEGDVAYQDIYKKAKSSVIIIDDYIDVKTLQLLKAAKRGVSITIVTDNKAQNNINATFIKDSGLRIQFKHNNNVFHDRFVILDYKTKMETFYHCGASSKDAGKRITAINKLGDGSGYYSPIDKALAGPSYRLR